MVTKFSNLVSDERVKFSKFWSIKHLLLENSFRIVVFIMLVLLLLSKLSTTY